jgi:hypothetical protein
MGSHPCCPPSPEHKDDSGALFDEVERVLLLKVTPLITLDDLYRRSSNRQAAAMMTIEVMEFLARPSRAVRVLANTAGSQTQRAALPGIQKGKSWDWIFGKFPGRTRPAIRTRWEYDPA